VLEIGCGGGVAVALLAERLEGGCVTGIDRSATAIDSARRRNAERIAAGTVRLVHCGLTDASGLGEFDKIFAVNVNVFWARRATAELQVIRELMNPGGTLRLCYETPPGTDAGRIAGTVEAVLREHGFTTATTASEPRLICVAGTC
jgi:cyclopropane fatty-acyl-phospholipid synthase-like methyltransferase